MKSLLKPQWIFVVNTLPLLLLSFLFTCDYNIIRSLLNEDNFHMWTAFTVSTALLVGVNIFYSFYLINNKKVVPFRYAWVAFFVHLIYVYLFIYNSERLVPGSIPQWLLSGEPLIYILTFLMPTLIYCLFLIVIHSDQLNLLPSAGRTFVYALLIPLVIYLFTIAGFNLPYLSEHVYTTAFILVTSLFLFFIVSSVYTLSVRKNQFLKSNQLLWKLVFSLLLPLTGLLVNNGVFGSNFGNRSSGIFGNFDNNWFYILAVLNGIFICIPQVNNRSYRLILFFGRCATFIFTFYFFVVFLPYLPISIVAIVLLGTGFLMLTPLLLIVIHAIEISEDYHYLREKFDLRIIVLSAVFGILLIPCYMTVSFLEDRRTLNKALDYIYTPDYSKKYKIDSGSLENTIESIKSNKGRGRGLFTSDIPYISRFFKWIVLENLSLSDSKIETIEKVFLGKNDSFSETAGQNINSEVELSQLTSQSRFDISKNAWISSVDLILTNADTIQWQNEYRTIIDLPAGCWISDYYLNIGDKKEFGILSEKKAAMWIYSQIVTTRRDPGILYYLTGNKVAFRVFPFAKNEVRKTGIEFIHKEPVILNIDGKEVALGKITLDSLLPIHENSDVVYVSAEEKSILPKINRKPYYHFLIDASKNSLLVRQKLVRRIDRLLSKNIIGPLNAKISFVGSNIETVALDDKWAKTYMNKKAEGGYFLDRGVRKVLFDSYKSHEAIYPVIVTVTDSLDQAILEDDFSDFSFAFPESKHFFELDEFATLKIHSLVSDPHVRLPDSTTFGFENNVLRYDFGNGKSIFLPDNNQSQIILKNENFDLKAEDISEKNWTSGLLMQGKWMSGILHPENSNRDWNSLVKYSFLSGIMTPVTSFLVVENQAQKEMLKKKQKESLSSNISLDLGEQTMSMSEPHWIFTTTIFILLFIWYRRKI